MHPARTSPGFRVSTVTCLLTTPGNDVTSGFLTDSGKNGELLFTLHYQDFNFQY